MRKYEYSKDLVNIVKQFLVDDDWHLSDVEANTDGIGNE